LKSSKVRYISRLLSCKHYWQHVTVNNVLTFVYDCLKQDEIATFHYLLSWEKGFGKRV